MKTISENYVIKFKISLGCTGFVEEISLVHK